MKKYVAKIIAAVLVLVLLVGGTVLLNLPEKGENSATEPNMTALPVQLIYDEAEENVKSIVAESEGLQIEFTRLNDGSWTINNLTNTEFDKSKAKAFAQAATRLVAESMIEADATDLEQYGLNFPAVTVTINKNDGSSDTISIGAKSAVNDSFFVKTSLSEGVYELSAHTVELLSKPISYYTEFVRFAVEDTTAVSAVIIERSDAVISFMRDEADLASSYEPWKLTSPINALANSDYILNDVLENIASIVLSKPVQDGEFGFDKPSARLMLTIKPYDSETGEYMQEYTEELIVGKKAEGNVFVSYDGEAYTVPAEYLEFVNTSLFNIVMKTQAIVNIAEVESVEMNSSRSNHILRITHSGNDKAEMSFKLDETTVSTEEAKNLYQELIGIQIDGIYNGEPMGESIMAVNYKGYNGADDVNIEFKVINDLECAFVKNGEINFTIKKSTIEALIDKIESYIKQ